jgi:hypothetical protein
LKVTDIIAFSIISAVKIGKKRKRPLKVTFNTKKPVVTAKQCKRLKKDTINISSFKPSEKHKQRWPLKESTIKKKQKLY